MSDELPPSDNYLRFREELERLINHYSIENGSDTPDFMLAEYLIRCLETFDVVVNSREQWYGRKSRKPFGELKAQP